MAAVADEFGLEPVSTTEDFGLEPVSDTEDFGLEPAPVDSGQSRAGSAVNRFLKTVQSDIGSTISGGARAATGSRNALAAATARQLAMQGAMADEGIPAELPRSTPESRARAAEESIAFQTGRNVQGAAEETFPTNPRFADTNLEAVASGLGSVPVLAGLGAVTGPLGPVVAGGAYGLNAGEQAVQEAGKIIDGRIAEAMAAGDFDTAKQLSKDKARLQENAGIKNAVIGAVTEGALGVAGRVIPLGKGRTLGKTFDKAIEKAIPRSIGPVARGATKSAAEGAVREGVQETTEQIASNMAAWEYDPDRDAMEGVIGSGGAGGAVGGIVGGLAGGLSRGNRRLLARERLMNRRTDQRQTVADTQDPNDPDDSGDGQQAEDVQEALGALPLATEALKELEGKAPEAEKAEPVAAPVPEVAPILSAHPEPEPISPKRAAETEAASASTAPEAPLVEGAVLPEHVMMPAIRGQDGVVRTGQIHALIEGAGEPGTVDGYVTNTGRFVPRAEGEAMPQGKTLMTVRGDVAAGEIQDPFRRKTYIEEELKRASEEDAPGLQRELEQAEAEIKAMGFVEQDGIFVPKPEPQEAPNEITEPSSKIPSPVDDVLISPTGVPEPEMILIQKARRASKNTRNWPKNEREGYQVVFSPYGPEGSGFYLRKTVTKAQKPKRKRPYKMRKPEDRPEDIIDDYMSNDGRRISLRAAKKLISDFNPTGTIKDLFTNDPDAILPDEAAKSVPKQPIDEDFLRQLQEAADARQGQRVEKRQETEKLDAAGAVQLQTEDFQTEISKPKEGESGVSVEGLFKGSEFELDGEKMRVKELHFDPDSGDLAFVEIQDGRRFGTQTVGADRMIFPDKGTFKENAPTVDFEPIDEFGLEADSEADIAARKEADKLKADAAAKQAFEDSRHERMQKEVAKPLKGNTGDLGQGDLLKPVDDLWAPPTPKPKIPEPKFKEGDKVIVGEYPMRRPGVISGSGPYRDGQHSYFVRSNMGENWYPESQVTPETTGKPGQYAIDPAAPPSTRPNLFDPALTDEEIATFFEPDPAPGRPGEARPTSRLSFATYEEFRDWMNARFAENDLDGMTDGIKDSSSAFKVRYIKETRNGDPNLRDVLSHLATASPLPAGWAPVTRATPRPNPGSMGGSRAPTATPPPSRPAGPPPPPRTPTPYEKFSISALVQLHRLFGKYPRINRALKDAYGIFKNGEVGLKQRLLWDKELATRVLSHEIGHFIDLAIEKFGKGRQFANRWQPLRSFMKKIADKIEIRRAAVALSQAWRGPFTAADTYRNSPSELFADAMSAILTKPQWVSDNFPVIHDTFQALLTGKPAFRTAYDQVTAWLQGDELAAVASGQMRQGFQESRRKLAEGEKRMIGGFKDWLKQLLVDPWFRVADIEGNPRELGKRGIDILGSLRALPARMNALMKDDFIKTVQPFLDKIQGGGEKARDIFAEFLTARRVIHERRAAGQWIEQNPDDAYKLIEEILKNHAGLRSKWGGQFASLGDTPTGTQLYDFAAAMFREVHDGGEAMVKSVADTIDDLKLGVSGDAALLAFNVRGKLLNPSGIDVNEAQNILNRIDSSLTPTERTDLDTAARGFYDIAHKTMEMAHDMGLISDKAWNEIVLPNRYNYVPFAVAEYWDGHVGAAMKPQYGTAKDVIDPVIALQQKLASMHRWIQRQAQVQALIQAYTNGGYTVTPTKRLEQASDIHKKRAKSRNEDVSKLVLWKNGQPYLVEFPDDPMHSFETAMEKPFAGADFARMWYSSQLGFIPEASGWVLALYTTLSPSFTLWRNPIRDTKTTAQHIGYSRTARAANQVSEIGRLAWNYAQAGYGTPMDPEVRSLVEKGVLPPPRSHHLIANSPEELEQLILRGRIMASEIALYRNARRHGRLAKAIQPVLEKTDMVTSTQEAASKILAYKAAKLKPGISDAKAIALAKRSGIPMPGIQGTASWLVEQVFPWTRVHIQGARGSFDIAKDPEMGREFMARVAMFEFAPRLGKYLFASGLAGMVLGGGDKEDSQDGVAGTLGEFYRRASPYKMAIDSLTPLAWFDTRTGEYHPISDTFAMKAKNIPAHWEAVSIRPPSSEEGKLWGSLFYGILAGTTPGQTGRSGQGVAGNVMDWVKSQGATGLNPGAKMLVNTAQLMAGTNVKDDFRGQPIANKDLYAAGGIQKAQAIVGATLNQLGDAGKLAALALESVGLPIEATQPTQTSFSGRVRSSLSKLPALSYDNYAQFRDQKVADAAEERSRAQIRLLMSPEVREMYDFANKNRSKVKTLDARDAKLYQAAASWYRDVYGNAVQEGTIVNQALAAVDKDGSLKAKETVKHDLAERSAVYLKVFQAAK